MHTSQLMCDITMKTGIEVPQGTEIEYLIMKK